jgi:hypothetical protein
MFFLRPADTNSSTNNLFRMNQNIKPACEVGKSLLGIGVFQGDLTEIIFGLQESIHDLRVKVGPLLFGDDLNGFLMGERRFVNPVAGQGVIAIG